MSRPPARTTPAALFRTMINPWLRVPAEDYETHMASPGVGQLQVLDTLLEEDLRRFAPSSLAVLGCATGNGFRHIQPLVTRRVVGVDLNPSYLGLVRERYAAALPQMELVCADISQADLEPEAFDLIHAALIFEYVDPSRALDRIVPAIRPGGCLTVVLQRASDFAPPVSVTGVESVRLLSSLLRLVEPAEFRSSVDARGLKQLDAVEITLPHGKRFHVAHWQRPPS